MRKIVLSLLLVLAAMTCRADEQKKVTLSTDHTHETINMSFCNIFVTMNEGDDDQSGVVNIEVENLDESKALILFDRSYAEKTVKKMSPSMVYDKTFGGTKGKRVTESYSESLSRMMLFRPSDKYGLPQFNINNDESHQVRLPLYIAKYKGKKLILLEKQVFELDITAELKPSQEYIELSGKVEELVKEMENVGVCTNAKHRPSTEEQKEAYLKRAEALKEQIKNIQSTHGWIAGDRGYERYDVQRQLLDTAKLTERDCGRHKVGKGGGGHSCSYCGLSLQQIYHQLDDVYKKIYSSPNRSAAKASMMQKVEALYGCCTAANCSKHAAQWKKGGDYKNKIVERYNRIMSL